MKKGFIALWAVFILVVFFKECFIGTLPALVVFLWSAVLSVWLLIKNGLPSKKGRIVSAVLTAIVLITGLTVHKNGNLGTVLFVSTTLLSSLAVISVSEKFEDVKLLRSESGTSILKSLLIGAVVAVPLCAVNVFFMSKNTPVDMVFGLSRVLGALHPGIAEDMAFRAVIMAFCVYISGGKMTKWQTFTMYVMMTQPHGLMHDMDTFSCVMAAIVFGIPFALLQRKRDVSSAMFSHFLVDAVRFVLFGG